VGIICLNGGTCLNNPGSFTCNCAQGWTGKYCGTGKNSLKSILNITESSLFLHYNLIQNIPQNPEKKLFIKHF